MVDERIAIYPGSFDPLTLGHDDIVRRCLRLVDRVLIAIAGSASEAKSQAPPEDGARLHIAA